MARAISRAFLRVCPIAPNYLAEAYLDQLLRIDPRICALNLKQYVRLSPSCRRNIIFVIDHYGMEVPLRECLRQLRDHSSDAKFLVLDKQKSMEEIVRVLIMGAHGYVSHTDVPSTLLRAVFCISANQLWVPSEVLAEFLCEVSCVLRKDTQARQATTPREDEVLELVRRRFSNREIADLLRIRVSTVKFHLSNVLSKLHANSRRQLMEAPSQNLLKLQLQ